MDWLCRLLTLPNTPRRQIQFMNAQLRHLDVTLTMIAIIRWGFIARAMATLAYVITAERRVLEILVFMP